jgi:hypothetical protein
MRGTFGFKPVFRFPRTRWEYRISSGGLFGPLDEWPQRKTLGRSASGVLHRLFLMARKEKMPAARMLR